MIVLKSSGDYSWPWADATDEAEAERCESAASLAVGSRERPAKLRKNAAKNSI